MRKHLSVFALIILILAAFVPVLPTQAQANCYYALPTRLIVGGQGRVTLGPPNTLRNRPYRGYDSVIIGQIPGGAAFNVIGGPNCFDGAYWWQVTYGGVTGWTPEGSNDGTYWTEPITITNNCMNVPSRLTTGQIGQVLPGLPNVLRSQPNQGANSTVLANLYPGSTFAILNGPSCSNGMIWWQVQVSSTLQWGWTAEGQGNTYWLQPYHSAPPPPQNTCNPYGTPHLQIGYTGIVAPGIPNNLRQQPSLNASIITAMPSNQTFTVLSGPNCVNGLNWWQVNDGGTVGWTVEGQNGQYWLNTLTCPGFQTSRLSIGRQASVTPGLPNRLRMTASTGSYALALIPSGARFSVIGGPVCSEGSAWWQVSYAGIVGWTMEGQGNQYWLNLAA